MTVRIEWAIPFAVARAAGTRNADFGSSRAELVRRMRAHLLGEGGANASFRELATAAGVSPATLRHYFATRTGAISAVLEAVYEEGAPYLLLVTRPPTVPLTESLTFLCSMVVSGLSQELGAVHALGLAAGLTDPDLGPAYLDRVLEPTQQAFEAHLAHHLASGALREGTDLRLAALQLLSPLVIAVLHQKKLGGTRCRPLDVQAIVAPHVAAFVRAWGTAAS